jgi:amino acid permease
VIIVTTIIGLVVTTFTDFINIAGAVGSVTVAFILPEILYLKVYGNKMSFGSKLGCVFISIFGILGSIYSIYYSISKMLRGDYS